MCTATEHKSFDAPDETRTFPNGEARDPRDRRRRGRTPRIPAGLALVQRRQADRQTESCEAPHFQYHVSGRLAIRMDDGTEFIAKAGDVTSLPSGHDAWVVGDEPVVVVDWYGASNYAKAS